MDLFSTAILIGVVQDLKAMVRSALLDRFFPTATFDPAEEIHFDLLDNKRRLAPFVSPLVEGQIVAANGHVTKTFKPAYVKPKGVWLPNQALKRPAGAPLAAASDPANNTRIALANMLTDHIGMIKRRMEVMAAEALRTGKVTVSGDKYPTQVVDFLRAAGQSIVKAGGSKWSDAGTSPLNDLQDWAMIVLQASGAMPIDVVMSVDVWKIFRAHAEVKDRLNLQRAANAPPTMGQAAQMEEGLTLQGTIDNFNIFTYAGWYRDDNDVEQPILPAGTVIMANPTQLEGVQAFGAILDERAGYRALDYFPTSWVDNDPPVRFVMTQSAPLVVPCRVSASLCATVL